MYGYDDPTPAEIASAVALLRERGVASVDLAFSGGNDEGGVDITTFLDAEGKPVDVPTSNAYRYLSYQGGQEHDEGFVVWDRSLGDKWDEQRRPATDEEVVWAQLHQTLAAPIYARYYSFAGEFYVTGNLHWDVDAGTFEMTGQESHEVWEDI